MQTERHVNEKVCKHCGQVFYLTSNTRGQFCSKQCYQNFRQANPGFYRKNALVTLTCDGCGKTFQRRKHEIRSEKVYCSAKCSAAANSRLRANGVVRGKVTKTCEECGKEYTLSHAHSIKRRFCSRECNQAARSRLFSGENNPNFRHGKNRNAAKWNAYRWYPKRCAICGFDIAVEIHHIRPIAKDGMNSVENLIILCPNHHAMAGRNMFTEDELQAAAKAARFPKLIDNGRQRK